MKKFIITVASLLAGLSALGQITNETFESLQMTSTPAYVILGVEPENIQRPNSPASFVASAQSAIVNQRLQPNFAMETSPYYWSKKDSVSKTTRYSPTNFLTNENYWDNLLRSFTFSLATSPSDSFTFGSIPTGTGLGVGFHLQLAQGKISKTTRNRLASLYQSLYATEVLNSFRIALDVDDEPINVDAQLKLMFERHPEWNLSDFEKQEIKNYIRNTLKKRSVSSSDRNLIEDEHKKLVTMSQNTVGSLTKVALTREGFMLELSYASALIAEQSLWEEITHAKSAVWLTPSYRFNTARDPLVVDYIDAMAVLRMTFNSSEVDVSDYVDGGLKMQWIHNRFSLSGESIFRFLTEKPPTLDKSYTWRNDVSFSYKVTDAITFKATFGSNFDGTSTRYSDPSKMFAVGGFNFGFGSLSKASDN